ncbi:hypothetical protein WA026_020813 [Henosepilachna vigintioctopunctata]|uniref:Uncharacterized protein n=1 Tax=Henosepilachna vigintioctopunctata TaxID=420089 RepID=A0AAW1TXK6_9CUCU
MFELLFKKIFQVVNKMEFEFSSLRRDLDSLGYFETFSDESVPLVAKLLNDLKTTTTSLQKYIKIAQNGIREKKNIHHSTELKTDFSKILKDCDVSHLTHLNHRCDIGREIKELRRHLSTLATENSKLVLENDELKKKVYDSELDQMKPLRPTRKTHGNYLFQSRTNCLSSDGELLQENLEMKHELNELKKELKNLQCQCNHLDSKDLAKSSSNEEDILLSKHSQEKVFRLLDDVRNLTREKNELDKSYKEALAKQHEAMRRAIHLAERNRELERELKDIDQMAIAVEEECNDAVNDRTKKLTQLESALRDALVEVQRLEKTISSMKKEKWESEVNKDVDDSEKNQVSCTCKENESANLNDQLNNMKIIEQDLNLEIDRLVRENDEQKRMITEMEYRLSAAQAPQSVTDNGPGGDSTSIHIKQKKKTKGKRNKSQKKTKRKGKGGKKGKRKLKKRNKSLKNPKTNKNTSHVPVNSPIEKKMSNTSQNYFPADSLHLPTTVDTPQTDLMIRLESSTQTETSKNLCNHFKKPILSCSCGLPNGIKCCTEKTTVSDAFRNGCCANMCFEHFQALLRKEIERCYCKAAAIDCCSQCPKMKQKIDFMQQENKRLSDEKITLMARLEASRDDNEIFGKCHRSACKRTQRERDLFKADVARLEEESDCLRDKLKELCESKKREQECLRQQINDYERALRKIESEHSELLNTQNTRRAQINAVDKKNEFLEEMLRNSQDDLKNQKILYVQLKALHDQTDKALFNTQTQLNELEQELASARNTIEIFKTAKPKADEHNRIAEGDLNSMKRQLNKIDREKDDLLNIVDSKTEEIATLRQNLKTKCDLIESLKSENSQLRSKFGRCNFNATS